MLGRSEFDLTHHSSRYGSESSRVPGPIQRTASYSVDGVWAASDEFVITVDGEPVECLRD